MIPASLAKSLLAPSAERREDSNFLHENVHSISTRTPARYHVRERGEEEDLEIK